MVVGVLQLELLLYSPNSLKEKRGIVRRILDRCRVRFPVSCAETGLQDTWQRSQIGFAIVGHDQDFLLGLFRQIEEEIVRLGSVEIIDRQTEILQY